MKFLLVFVAALAWVPVVQAFDLGSVLNSTIQREVNRKVDSGVTGVFRSIEEATTGSNTSNVQIQGASSGQVVMYSRAGCGYCTKARKHMQKQNISFVEKDVGRDAGAAAELRSIDNSGGVPVLVMGKHKVRGFSESSFNATYAKFQADQPKGAQAVVGGPGFNAGDVLVARIAKVKLLADATTSSIGVGLLDKNEEVIYLGEFQGSYVKVRGAEHEGWVDKTLLSKP